MSGDNLLRVALVQANTTVGDFDGNAKLIAGYMESARKLMADIVIFPELALCGYPPEDLLLRGTFIEDNQRALRELLPASKGITAVIGYAEASGGDAYNAAALVHDGRLIASYHKVELPNYGVFDEKRYFAAGKEPLTFSMKGLLVGLSICEDLWVVNGDAERGIRKSRVDVVLNISASPFHAGKAHLREGIVSGLAERAGAFVFYTNLVGGQDELVFDGGGIVAAPGGGVVASYPRFSENIVAVDIDTDDPRLKNRQRRADSAGDRHGLTVESTVSSAREKARMKITSEMTDLEEVYAALVMGTRDYVIKNGFEKVALGLSGGIDSALTACIAVEALGKENVIGVTMPSEYTSAGTRTDAGRLAENLGIRLITVPISGILKGYESDLADAFGPGAPGIEHENLQARIRGNILMALSNRFGWLVLTTGNKSEIATGYCTLYGDMAGGFAVIKDVLKTMVYGLSEMINGRAGREIIPGSTIERAPTAELKPGQKDEDSLPPYSTLDPILHEYVEEDRGIDEIVEDGFDAETVAEVIRMVDRSEYKRRQAPPGVKITPKAFGRDRRLPVTSRYRQRPPK